MNIDDATTRAKQIAAKRLTVEQLLREDSYRSNSEIARLAGVGHPFVAKIRAELGDEVVASPWVEDVMPPWR